jgi:hypothetical protein
MENNPLPSLYGTLSFSLFLVSKNAALGRSCGLEGLSPFPLFFKPLRERLPALGWFFPYARLNLTLWNNILASSLRGSLPNFC